MNIEVSEEEKSILTFYRTLDDDQKITFMRFMETLKRLVYSGKECIKSRE